MADAGYAWRNLAYIPVGDTFYTITAISVRKESINGKHGQVMQCPPRKASRPSRVGNCKPGTPGTSREKEVCDLEETV